MTGEQDDRVTDEVLKEHLPRGYKLPKTPAQRADLLYELDAFASEERRKVTALEKAVSLLERWFVQNLPETAATGVAGKLGRVQIVNKDIPIVEDWDKFYAHVAKTKSFDLLQRRLSEKAVKERWEANKVVPGTGHFNVKKVSLTKVK